jgi:hypothetical protein
MIDRNEADARAARDVHTGARQSIFDCRHPALVRPEFPNHADHAAMVPPYRKARVNWKEELDVSSML